MFPAWPEGSHSGDEPGEYADVSRPTGSGQQGGGARASLDVVGYPVAGAHVERLLVELVGHGDEDDADAFVKLAFREMAAMVGMSPKPMWSLIHDQADSCRSVMFRLT